MCGGSIVVGSGPNGLAAAIRLAESGRPVVVLEAADAPGGAVRTEELTLPGFRHDTFSSVYPAGAASPVFARMPLAQHGLRWVHPRACYAHPLDGGDAVVLYRDLEATVASLERQHQGDGEAWRTFATPFLDHFGAVRSTLLTGFPPLRGPLELLARAGPAAFLRFLALMPASAAGLGHELFRGSGSRAWLAGSALHGAASVTSPGGAIAAAYLNLLGHVVGWPSPLGGAQALTDALVAHLKSLGGELRTSSRVERIVSVGGTVTGVALAGGEQLPARTVMADVMPHALIALTGDALTSWYRARLSRYTYGASTLKVDWALEQPIPWTDPEVRGAGTVHVGGTEDDLLADLAASRNRLPERPFLLVGQQSVADATRAPAGRHTAWAYTHGPQDGVDWLAEQDRHVERIEAQVERFAPGFRRLILARHVSGPAGLQARNANLVGGDVGGGAYSLRQTVFRPLPKRSPYRTPIDGLYLCSAATFPGGGVHGIPGDAAARAAIRAI